MTVRTRAIDLRRSWLCGRGSDELSVGLKAKTEGTGQNVHPVELRRSASSYLLRAELTQLCFEIHELLLQIILALSPKLTGADLCS